MTRALVFALLGWLCAVPALYAQSDSPRLWLAELNAVERTSAGTLSEREARLVALHRQIAEWLALNPSVSVHLPPAVSPVNDDEELARQAESLRNVIEEMLRYDPNRPFYLGFTSVNVTAPVATLSPVSDRLDGVEIQRRQALTVNQAIEYLPGVSVDHKAPRNQTGISIGGFDSRQVPLYLDGIPAYPPFDGYVDLTRYLTSDVAEVEVAKGYSSPLLGPNLLGGVVNVVTRQPQRAIEGDAFLGTAPGNQVNTGVHVGSRWRGFFFQASADRLQSDFYPMSGSFPVNAVQAGDHRANSDQRDERYRLRLAWTPRRQDQYVVSYSTQNGATGIPPYSGATPPCPSGTATISTPCVTPKFWRWPFWNADAYYFNSRTQLGERSALQLRAFHAGYSNQMDMFDDASYASMNLNTSSGRTRNDDHSTGVSGQVETLTLPRHTLAASFFVKHDRHTEQTTTFTRDNVAATTPLQTDRDRQSSFGIRDSIVILPVLRATIGLSADQLNGLEAQDLSGDRTHVVPFQVSGVCSAVADRFDSCTDHVWTVNPVGSVTFSSETIGSVFVTVARKSRFPTIKDRYSYKAGRAIPNPLLNPERAQTWTTGIARTIAGRTVAQIEFFRSDVQDEIENIFFLSPLCAGGGRGGAGSCQQAVNVGSELHDGVTVTLRSTAVSRVTIDGSYGFLHREVSGTPGVFPSGTPTHKVLATVSGRLPHSATAVISARHERGRVAMSDNGLPLPSADVTTVDIGATMPIYRGLALEAGIKNLLDANYYYWEGFPEPGRNAHVTVRYVF